MAIYDRILTFDTSHKDITETTARRRRKNWGFDAFKLKI